jgi:hypothetical protein
MWLGGNGCGPDFSFSGDEGRIQLVRPGAAGQKDVATNVGAPISLAVGADKTIYFVNGFGRKVMSVTDGATPALMPFDTDDPKRIAVGPEG